jgi:UDP-glucose 4-epimerase
MILVTGGLGFIGSHTARALTDRGQTCVLTSHNNTRIPPILGDVVGERAVVEQVDISDAAALRALGRCHAITGIVHLADPAVARVMQSGSTTAAIKFATLFEGLGNMFDAACEWMVDRLTIVSTVGVYMGAGDGPWHEDAPLRIESPNGIPVMKKVAEALTGFAADASGISMVCVRPSGIWGPGGRNSSRIFALPGLVHAAVRPHRATPGQFKRFHEDDGGDLCYVTDCADAIALIHTATQLSHSTYNIGGGRAYTNAEVVASIAKAVPGFTTELSPGQSVGHPTNPYMDLSRLHNDTGFKPTHNLDDGIQKYVAWLRQGHER